MAISFTSDGLRGFYLESTTSFPVGAFMYDYNARTGQTLAGTCSAMTADYGGGVWVNIADVKHDSLHFRLDTQTSINGIDGQGLRNMSNNSSVKIGQFFIKSRNTAITSGGTYHFLYIWNGDSRTVISYDSVSSSFISDMAGIGYRYA